MVFLLGFYKNSITLCFDEERKLEIWIKFNL